MIVRGPEVAWRNAVWAATVLYIWPRMNPLRDLYHPTDRREPACHTAIAD